MGNIFNEDFQDFIIQLNVHAVRYILVGGYSVILHGYSRTTGDMDIWVERTEENYDRLVKAFSSFGMPVFDMTKNNFLTHPSWDVFTFGAPPSSIDIMVRVKGMNFSETFEKAVMMEVDNLQVRTIHITDLITAKKASNRAKDINDLENLT